MDASREEALAVLKGWADPDDPRFVFFILRGPDSDDPTVFKLVCFVKEVSGKKVCLTPYDESLCDICVLIESARMEWGDWRSVKPPQLGEVLKEHFDTFVSVILPTAGRCLFAEMRWSAIPPDLSILKGLL